MVVLVTRVVGAEDLGQAMKIVVEFSYKEYFLYVTKQQMLVQAFHVLQ